MAQEQITKMDENGGTVDMFSFVWVKMEVDEDGVVEGVDSVSDERKIKKERPEEQEEQETEPWTYQNKSPEDQATEPWTDHNESQEEQEDQETQAPDNKCIERKPTQYKERKSGKKNHLKCSYCDYRTSYKNALKYHEMDHTNPNPLKCQICDYTTKYPWSLQRHVLVQHTSKEEKVLEELPKFKCLKCPYISIYKGNLAAHMRKHSEVKNFKCEHCDFSTAYKHSFVKHSKTHKSKDEEQVTYKCDKCPFFTKYEGHISRHLAQIHKEVSEKAKKCDHCEFTTKLRWRLNIHMSRSRKTSSLTCEFCEFVTHYNCAFKMHKMEHIGLHCEVIKETAGFTQYKNFQPIGTRTVEEINSDIQTDGLIEAQADEQREAPSLSSTSLNNQLPSEQLETNLKNQFIIDTDTEEIDWQSIEVTERPGEEKPFGCTQCEYIGRYKASVQRHFQRHHTSRDIKPYKCLKCDFSTKTRDQISSHTKRSQSTQIIRCNNCEFTTYFKCVNAMHQKSHNRYKCKLCDYSCRQNFDIQQHYAMVHLGNGLKCRYCDFKSTRKDTILTHEMVHTGKKPFKCSLCDYSATRRAMLQNHMRKAHSENDPIIIDQRKIESLSESTGFSKEREHTDGVLESESNSVCESESKHSTFDSDLQKLYDIDTTVEGTSL